MALYKRVNLCLRRQQVREPRADLGAAAAKERFVPVTQSSDP